jgi:hypothetical protein
LQEWFDHLVLPTGLNILDRGYAVWIHSS